MRNSGGYVSSVAVTFKGDTLGELRIVTKVPWRPSWRFDVYR